MRGLIWGDAKELVYLLFTPRREALSMSEQSINRLTQIMNTPFETFLNQHDEEAWSAALTTLLRSIHDVDRNATQIWFAFYPLSLFQALEHSEDRDTLAQRLLL